MFEALQEKVSRRGLFTGATLAGATILMGGTGTSLLSGCASTPSSSGKSDTLTIYVGEEPEDGFDPLTGWGYNGSYILFQSYLVKFGKNLELQPDLATEWKVSADALTYTFKLREGVKFSDGTPFTAEDVAFSYLTARDNGAAAIDLTRLASAQAIDKHTVEFKLKTPYSSFPQLTGMLGIVPKASYHPQNYRLNPVGTGPFKMKQWDKGQQVILEPNEHYYGTKSAFKQITLVFIDGETALTHAQSGRLDVVMVQPEYAKSAVKGMTLQTFDTIDTRGFNLPTAKASVNAQGVKIGNNVTSDHAIRKALSIGISRQAIVDGALNGVGTPSTAMITLVPWKNDAASYKDGRVDEAKKLLDEAGWMVGSDGIRVKNGQRASFEVTGRTDDLQRYNIAVGLAQEAKKLGIEIKARSEAWDQCKKIADSTPTCWGTGDYDPAGDLAKYFGTEGRINRSQYSNPKVDEYIRKALETTDAQVSLDNWKKMQWDGSTGPESENGDMPFIWIASIDHTYFVRDGLDLGEQLVHPHGHGWPIVSNLNEWKWK